MWKKVLFTSLVVAALAPVSSVLAEGPQDGAPPPIIVESSDPSLQQPGQEVAVQEEQRQGRGVEYGAHLLVPIFARTPFRNTLPGVGLSPGIGIQGRVGWEFPNGFTTELNLGFAYNGITGTSASNPALTNFWVGAGARYSFLNASALVPFVGAGVAVHFWTAQFDDGFVTIQSESELALGLNVLGGFAYELSPEIALEAGLQANFTTASFSDVVNPVERSVYLTPFLGGTLYY